MTFTLQPIPLNLVDQGIAKGGNPLGLPRMNHQCELSVYVTGPVFMVTAAYLCRVDDSRGLARCQ